jgi:hypothetical protein
VAKPLTHTTCFDPPLHAEILAALAIGFLVVFGPLLRWWYRRWGALNAEAQRALPGDELVPHPRLVTTRAITIYTPAADIWPWLVQIGQGRGGFYSYTRLENLAGCNIHNADHIIEDLQHLQVGDKIYLAPKESGAPSFEVAAIYPRQALVLRGGGGPSAAEMRTSWTFFLAEQIEGTTRLIARYRMDYPPHGLNRVIWEGLLDPIFFIMERCMLQGIRQRAEATAG